MELAYTLLRSRKRRKTICLQVGRDGRIVIRAPFFTPRRAIDEFFRSREPWLKNHLRDREKARTENIPQVFEDGEIFLFMGSCYPLRIEQAESGFKGRLHFDSQRFLIGQGDIRQGREIFVAWYREQAERHLEERLKSFSRQLDLVPRSFRITDARSYWGSCSAADRLAFNWRLIMAPRSVIDYVVVHELQHLVEKNHSPAFWQRVARVLPDYEDQKRWLRRNGRRLNL